MILGGKNQGGAGDAAANRTTLDDLFRRAGVRRPDAVALIDPDNRASFTDGAPRRLSYAEADRAISALAARLRRLGLQTDTVVAMQLANTVDSVVTFLGVLRAGMIAAPMPLLWRRQEMVAGLGRIGAKAIIAAARLNDSAPAEVAMQAAAEMFPIRHVCAFGEALPDGVVPLDDIFANRPADFAQPQARAGNAAAHVALVTFDLGANGPIAVARNHGETISGGLAPYLESGAALDGNLLSAIPLGSFAGVALNVVPWLLGGGTLCLHHAFDPDIFAAQCRAQGGTIVLPGPALLPLADAGKLGDGVQTIVALWRSPEKLATAAAWHGGATLVDVASFGETGLIAARRGPDGTASPIPCGIIAAPQGAPGAVAVAEAARGGAGTLALRGPMVPGQAFPPGAERGHEPYLTADDAGFVDTGFACYRERDRNTLTIGAPPGGMTSIGGYRFRQRQIDAEVAAADPAATIVALPDAYLGLRLAGSAADDGQIRATLQARGANPLIAGAFQARKPASKNAA